MGRIGGNVTARVVRSKMVKSARGAALESGTETIMDVRGWLDYQSGQDSHQAYGAELADTTHLFLCDYDEEYAKLRKQKGLSLEIDGDRYEVLLIDDPMSLHRHIETFLRRVG